MPFDIVERSSRGPAGEHLGPRRVDPGVVRARPARPARPVAGEPQVPPAAAELLGPRGQASGPAGQVGQLAASAASGAGLRWAGLPSYQPP